MKKNKFANIIVNKKVLRRRSFLYQLPKDIKAKEGSLVLVPFRGKKVVGIIDSFVKDKQNPPFKVKEIENVLYPKKLLTKEQIALASYIAQVYFAPFPSVLFSMLPLYLRGIKRGSTVADFFKKNIQAKEKCNEKKNYRYLLFDPQDNHSKRIYKTAIKKNLKTNKNILFLIPDTSLEIAKKIEKLSPKSLLLNPNKNPKEQFKDWLKIRNNEVNILIGSHLALLSPLQNIGLIIVHQESNSMYKNEQLPKYHLRDVAKKLAQIHGASLILEDKIPTLESYLEYKNKRYNLLPQKSLNKSLGTKPLKIIDLRSERGLITSALESMLKNNLTSQKKTLLFLNRKGFSRFVVCLDCGHSKHLQADEATDAICPKCKGSNNKEHSFGTKKLEHELKKLFPSAKILRIDKENPEIKNLKLKIKNYDLVVATSYIFKQKFPLFDAVGVILAEIGLYLPDFRSEERLFRTLFNVLKLGKEKIIQTFYPNHELIQYLLKDDYRFFAENELEKRKNNDYPPYSKLIRLTLEKDKGKIKNEGEKLAKNLAELEKNYSLEAEILGPSMVFIQPKNTEKIEIILKGKNPYPLLSLVPPKWRVDIDPIELLK